MPIFRDIFRRLRSRRFAYQPLVEVRVFRQAILDNLHLYQNNQPGLGVAPILKSNAYGHGLVQVAQIIKKETVPFLGVDSFFEALILRNEHLTAPLLILGQTPLANILMAKLPRIAFSVLSLNELKIMAEKVTRPTTIHLKIDTGLHRHGLLPEELTSAYQLISPNPNLEVKGIYTHLADADTKDSVHLEKQIKVWNACVAQAKKFFPNLTFSHCAATAGAAYHDKITANVLRLGLGLYGFNIGSTELELKPALAMKTRVTSLRKIAVGESVGYNATFTADRPLTIATIPVGYTEGVDRRLSNKGFVLINNQPCPIIGRVSMNITSIDVTGLVDIKLADEVEVIGAEPEASNSVKAMAKLAETIPYEILVHLPSSLRRTIV